MKRANTNYLNWLIHRPYAGSSKTRGKEIQTHLGYFKKHKKFMEYAEYAEKGWPIGSGVIEAACKSVVKQRMCRSGQRWSISGGQAILNLRSVVKSNRWENFFWTFNKNKKGIYCSKNSISGIKKLKISLRLVKLQN